MEVESDLTRGTKRRASDQLENEQRLTKRLGLLNLEHNGKLYVPVRATSSVNPSPPMEELMHVDESKHKVFIHNLDEELAEIEEGEGRLVFIPEIEKHLSKIPQAVLASQDSTSTPTDQQLVLYNVPSSISVPKEHDNVRKVILEARARAKEKKSETSTDSEHPSPSVQHEVSIPLSTKMSEADPNETWFDRPIIQSPECFGNAIPQPPRGIVDQDSTDDDPMEIG